ncbi:bifunctional 5,10-methylenetetrahydrofolate dehydrogenase/5,10-methenyltetrahydrofolate cyclohydrolase [Streptobacillus moniliformis]|uniref:bifunctional 5,10-methylenetetrahydrofolate dehydrogenase/5,10-methenyltetrahydrofolate cyclohydrolase n=1 Tax=Streptobacillus moniliformis TaxID=34105 RepID=UPI0009BD65C8|nr:bifunctional 5,10-methylenetetrahydrofolate dehydrogenase/5,10-methenyltetrahydrofolate cyclohydrolase [Streptobacillus moniliformis]QXW65606.1 bifunctional 5,10-methylenetetrahydrofolate dehydrogenase/5,10-methenyltetrahydrofolate cyclohydrolase [Streptobacillus moniliformis]
MIKSMLDGRYVSNILYEKLKIEYQILIDKIGRRAGLAFIKVGNDRASTIYLKNKAKKCDELGIYQKTIIFEENITETELISEINKLNDDKNIDGILLQLPLPSHINYISVMSTINPKKDVDGFHPENVGNLLFKDKGIYSCTPQGIMELLNYYNISIESKDIVIIGRSNIVGKPLALMLINEGATVQVCNSKTKDLFNKTKQADILISATGVSHLIKSEYIKDGAVVIDVGISEFEGKIIGDVDFEDVIQNSNVRYITPVPGGVGPMTIYSLIKNTIRAFELNNM